MRAQTCPIPFEILAINNNSTDTTSDALLRLEKQAGPKLRWVTETEQGIVPARNRAIKEALEADILVFIDDDELPLPGLLEAVTHSIQVEGADCIGGPIKINFEPYGRPKWLDNELTGFLGEIDYGSSAFWVQDGSTPVWSGNVAYRMETLRANPELRFDSRYNREGAGIGGGSDAVMFRAFLDGNYKIRYRPDMTITHFVDAWKLKRSYFVRLHYRAGIRQGQFRMPTFPRTIMGTPPFLIGQFFKLCLKTLSLIITRKPGQVRQAMNASNALGVIVGYRRRTSA